MTAHTIGGWLVRQEMVRVAGPTPRRKPSADKSSTLSAADLHSTARQTPSNRNVQIGLGGGPQPHRPVEEAGKR